MTTRAPPMANAHLPLQLAPGRPESLPFVAHSQRLQASTSAHSVSVSALCVRPSLVNTLFSSSNMIYLIGATGHPGLWTATTLPAALVTDANMLAARNPPFSQQDPVRSWLLCSQTSAFLCPPGDVNASSLTGAPLKQIMPQFGRHDLNEQRRRGQPKNPKLYKTELCRSWMDYGRCNYGDRCQYAHGQDEKRPIPRHPKYKTEYCQSFHNAGYCPYGPRCHFIHTEKEHLEALELEQRRQQQHTTPSKPALVVIPTGYGSAGESPVPSSAGSGSDSPTSGSFSPGLSSSESSDDVFGGSSGAQRRPNAFQWPMPGDVVDSLAWDMRKVQLESSEPTTPTHPQAARLPVFARLSNGGN